MKYRASKHFFNRSCLFHDYISAYISEVISIFTWWHHDGAIKNLKKINIDIIEKKHWKFFIQFIQKTLHYTSTFLDFFRKYFAEKWMEFMMLENGVWLNWMHASINDRNRCFKLFLSWNIWMKCFTYFKNWIHKLNLNSNKVKVWAAHLNSRCFFDFNVKMITFSDECSLATNLAWCIHYTYAHCVYI